MTLSTLRLSLEHFPTRRLFLCTLFQSTLYHGIFITDILLRGRRRFREVHCQEASRHLQSLCAEPPWDTASLKFWICPFKGLKILGHWIQPFECNSCSHCFLWRSEDLSKCISWESGSAAEDLCAVGLWKGQKAEAMCWLMILWARLICVLTLGRMTNTAL